MDTKKFDEAWKLYQQENPDWYKFLTDSTYYEIKDWYEHKYGFEYDEDVGYADEVDEFGEYIWKQINPDEYSTKEYVQVEKELFKDLMLLLEDCADNGNCFASVIINKYKLNLKNGNI